VVVVTVAAGGRARAYPFIPPRQVPSAIAGPTDPHVASMITNPAALGALPGFHVWLDGGARLHLGSISRSPVDDGAGINPGGADIRWADLDAFLGATYAFRDYLTIGLAVHTPLTDFTSYGDTAVRYHAVDHTLAALSESAAVGARLSDRFYVGVSFSFTEAWLRYRFDRDTALAGGSALVDQANTLCGGPCGLENELARQRIGLRGFSYAIGFGLGIIVRPVDRLWLALSWSSPMRIFRQRAPDLALYDTRLVEVSGVRGEQPDPNAPPPVYRGNDQISILLPDVVQFGMRFEATPRIDFEAGARFINYGARRAIDVTLQGTEIEKAGLTAATRPPPQFLLDRGLQDAWGLWISGRFRARETLRLMPFVFFETSAVRRELVNAASIDSEKLDLSLVAEWKPHRNVTIGAHLGGTAYFLGDAGQGFRPREQVRCVDAAYSLDACANLLGGRALSEAAGRYTLFVLHAGAALGLDF
jgi:long-subunit fatty acid transport protein